MAKAVAPRRAADPEAYTTNMRRLNRLGAPDLFRIRDDKNPWAGPRVIMRLDAKTKNWEYFGHVDQIERLVHEMVEWKLTWSKLTGDEAKLVHNLIEAWKLAENKDWSVKDWKNKQAWVNKTLDMTDWDLKSRLKG